MVPEVLVAVSKPDNTHMKKGTGFSPLLEGFTQLGNLGDVHKNHSQKELQLRNAACKPADGIHVMSTKIKKSEHPGWEMLEEDTSEEQAHRLKLFSPRCLITQEWGKDHVVSVSSQHASKHVSCVCM